MGSIVSHSYEPQLPEGVYHNRTDYTTHDNASCSECSEYIRG